MAVLGGIQHLQGFLFEDDIERVVDSDDFSACSGSFVVGLFEVYDCIFSEIVVEVLSLQFEVDDADFDALLLGVVLAQSNYGILLETVAHEPQPNVSPVVHLLQLHLVN